MLPIYTQLSNVALRNLLHFSSTYMCEAGFSSLIEINSKKRSKQEVDNDLCCALFKTGPDIGKLAAIKHVQVPHSMLLLEFIKSRIHSILYYSDR